MWLDGQRRQRRCGLAIPYVGGVAGLAIEETEHPGELGTSKLALALVAALAVVSAQSWATSTGSGATAGRSARPSALGSITLGAIAGAVVVAATVGTIAALSTGDSNDGVTPSLPTATTGTQTQ